MKKSARTSPDIALNRVKNSTVTFGDKIRINSMNPDTMERTAADMFNGFQIVVYLVLTL